MIYRYLDPLALLLTRNINRIFPTAPVLHEWPPLKRIVVGSSLVVFRAAYAKVVVPWALSRRKKLSNTLFVGVTGSAGKTTAKEMIAAILSTQGSCCKTQDNKNGATQVASFMTRVKQSHLFCVAEISGGAPGKITQATMIVQPQIGVVTTIGTDHYSAFGSVEAIAEEKSQLVALLPKDGIAVLNADDHRVMAMAQRHAGQVITYGEAASALLRAVRVKAAWPDRLAFEVVYQGQSLPVQTSLYGRYWVTSVLAALAAGLAAGIPLATSIGAVANISPTQGRMNSMTDTLGATFLRDDFKAPLWSLPLVFDFMLEARAIRKIIIIGTIADAPGDSGRHYRRAAEQASMVADHVFFVGPMASHVLKAKPHKEGNTIRAFASAKEASDFLTDFLRSGDLVLLKGSTLDHLGRIPLARTTLVKCWREGCSFKQLCDSCKQLSKESAPSSGTKAFKAKSLSPQVRPISKISGKEVQVIVGLGNPGERFNQTPHNVGFQVLDCLADQLGVEWNVDNEILTGCVKNGDRTVHLIKPRVSINKAGPVLAEVCDRLGCGPEQCVLVFDDIALPLGSVRIRMSGSDGGHRGVRSILMAFQSEKFRRVKIGVGQNDQGKTAIKYLLSPFLPELRPTMEIACRDAAERAMKLVELTIDS